MEVQTYNSSQKEVGRGEVLVIIKRMLAALQEQKKVNNGPLVLKDKANS